MKSIAFDYGATLRVSDGVPELRALVRELNLLGVPVVVVSAISLPVGRWEAEISAEIEALTHDGERLVFAEIRYVYYPQNPTPEDMVRAGQMKAAACRDLGASVLIDDSSHVARGAASCGISVIRAAKW